MRLPTEETPEGLLNQVIDALDDIAYADPSVPANALRSIANDALNDIEEVLRAFEN